MYSIRYRMEAYETIDGLYKDLKQDYIENELIIRILAVINLIIDISEKMNEPIDIELITRKIITNIEDFGLLVNRHIQNLFNFLYISKLSCIRLSSKINMCYFSNK